MLLKPENCAFQQPVKLADVFYSPAEDSKLFSLYTIVRVLAENGVCARRFISRSSGEELSGATGASRILLSVRGMPVKKALITPRALFELIKKRFRGLKRKSKRKRHVLIKIISFHANFVSSRRRPPLNFPVSGLSNYCFRQRFSEYYCVEYKRAFVSN